MKIYKGDTGTAIVLDSGGEILDGETLKISILKPGADTPLERDAAVFESTKGRYVSVAEDFDTAGTYHMQLVITSIAGTWRGETVTFMVYNTFD